MGSGSVSLDTKSEVILMGGVHMVETLHFADYERLERDFSHLKIYNVS